MTALEALFLAPDEQFDTSSGDDRNYSTMKIFKFRRVVQKMYTFKSVRQNKERPRNWNWDSN